MDNFKSERVSIFIDGSNFYHSTKEIRQQGHKIKFSRLINELLRNRVLINVFYYVCPLDFQTNPKKYWEHQRFLAVLKEIPKFNVVLCTLKKFRKENKEFGFDVKGDDIHLANDLLSGAYENLYDTAIIVSGDEDFVPIIKTAQKLGKRIGNAYFLSSSSQALRQVRNFSIPLDKVIPRIIN